MKINENVDVSQEKAYSDYLLLKDTLTCKMMCSVIDICIFKNLTNPEKILKFSKCYELSFSQKSLSNLDMKKLSNATQMCDEIRIKSIYISDYVCL